MKQGSPHCYPICRKARGESFEQTQATNSGKYTTGRKMEENYPHFFPVKDKIDKIHRSNVVYYYKSDLPNIVDDYTGETKCRLGKRMKEHLSSDKESAIVKNF